MRKEKNIGIEMYIPSWGFLISSLESIVKQAHAHYFEDKFSAVNKNEIKRKAFLGDALLHLIIVEQLSSVVAFYDSNPTFIDVLVEKRISDRYLSEIYNILNLDTLTKALDRFNRELGVNAKGNVIEYLIYELYLDFGYEAVSNFISQCFISDMLYTSIFKHKLERKSRHFYAVGITISKYIVRKEIYQYNKQTIVSGKELIHHKRWSEIQEKNTELILDYYFQHVPETNKVLLEDSNYYYCLGQIQFLLGTKIFLNNPCDSIDLLVYRKDHISKMLQQEAKGY